MARIVVFIWNFTVGYFCTASIFFFHPFNPDGRNDLALQITGAILEIIGGIVTAILLTIFKNWGLAKYKNRKLIRKNKYLDKK